MPCCFQFLPDEIAAILALRSTACVVPFGGRSSVVGGVDPVRAGFVWSSPWICADSTPCTGSTRSRARLNSAPGSPGPTPNDLLGDRGFSLGHFPQSFRCHHRRVRRHPVSGRTRRGCEPVQRHGPRDAGADTGGYWTWAARRPRPPDRTCVSCSSAPRASSASSPGAVRVHPVPESVRYEAWSFPDFGTGAARPARGDPDRRRAHRAATVQRRWRPASTWPALAASASRASPGGCLAITVFEGSPAHTRPTRGDRAIRGRPAARRWVRQPPRPGARPLRPSSARLHC